MNCPFCETSNDASAASCSKCGTLFGQTPTSYVFTVDLRPGTVFHSRYEILSPLGRGGMGTVYKAYDRSLDETVAIKVLRPDFGQDPRMADRFKSEIKLARKVRHKNVCTIHDYGEEQGLLFISMELIEGVDLKHLLRERGGLPAEKAYDVGIQVAEGLQAVHDAGIVHRDLKTPNIMLDPGGVARLMDFGVAKRLGEGTLTATGQIVGTPEYMSPEQAQGHKLDFRSDIYALGVVLYELFTGRLPFRGDTPISTILKHLNDPPPLDGQEAARIPPGMKVVLKKALAKEPGQRYATARQLAEALRDARSPSRRQQPISTDVLEAPTLPAPTPRPPGPAPRRAGGLLWGGWPAWLAVGVGFLLLAGWFALPLSMVRSSFHRGPRSSPSPDDRASPPGGQPNGSERARPHKTPDVLIADAGSHATAAAPAALPPPVTLPPPAVPMEPRPAKSVPTAVVAAPSLRPSIRPATTPLAPVPAAAPPTVAPMPDLPPARPELPAAPGSLLVVVKPWGDVMVDGRLLGSTPLEAFSLPAGVHLVRIKHPAYEVLDRQVTIRPGESERLVVDLTTQGVRKTP